MKPTGKCILGASNPMHRNSSLLMNCLQTLLTQYLPTTDRCSSNGLFTQHMSLFNYSHAFSSIPQIFGMKQVLFKKIIKLLHLGIKISLPLSHWWEIWPSHIANPQVLRIVYNPEHLKRTLWFLGFHFLLVNTHWSSGNGLLRVGGTPGSLPGLAEGILPKFTASVPTIQSS